MLNVTVDGYASMYYATFVSMWIMTFQNKRNRKREAPLVGYAMHVTQKISVHESAPYSFRHGNAQTISRPHVLLEHRARKIHKSYEPFLQRWVLHGNGNALYGDNAQWSSILQLRSETLNYD